MSYTTIVTKSYIFTWCIREHCFCDQDCYLCWILNNIILTLHCYMFANTSLRVYNYWIILHPLMIDTVNRISLNRILRDELFIKLEKVYPFDYTRHLVFLVQTFRPLWYIFYIVLHTMTYIFLHFICLCMIMFWWILTWHWPRIYHISYLFCILFCRPCI